MTRARAHPDSAPDQHQPPAALLMCCCCRCPAGWLPCKCRDQTAHPGPAAPAAAAGRWASLSLFFFVRAAGVEGVTPSHGRCCVGCCLLLLLLKEADADFNHNKSNSLRRAHTEKQGRPHRDKNRSSGGETCATATPAEILSLNACPTGGCAGAIGCLWAMVIRSQLAGVQPWETHSQHRSSIFAADSLYSV